MVKDIRFVVFKDEEQRLVKGYFEILNYNLEGYLVILSSDNEFRIPIQQVLKIKKNLKGGHDKK